MILAASTFGEVFTLDSGVVSKFGIRLDDFEKIRMRGEMTAAVHSCSDRLTRKGKGCDDHPRRIWCGRDGKRFA